MDHHRVLRGVGLLVPHPAVDLLGGEDPAQIAHQEIHNLEFRGGEAHALPICPEDHLLEGVAQPAGTDILCPGRGVDVPQQGVPPQMAAHPGRQLLGVEGLGHIVVRPHGEPQDLVRVLALGRQDNDGQIPLLPDFEHGGQPVQFGHHHIHDDEPQIGSQGQIQGLHAVVGPENPVALLFQHNGDGPDDFGVVVHHKHAFVHRAPSSNLPLW